MIKFFFIAFIITSTISGYTQNLLQQTTNGCVTDFFGLDVGDIKTELDVNKTNKLIDYLNSFKDYENKKGKLYFQIIIDSFGKGCVQSHSPIAAPQVKNLILNSLNNFDGYTVATTNGKKEYKNSVIISFEINNKILSINVQRVDQKKFLEGFEYPIHPEIYGDYEYKNKSLRKYKIKTLDRYNSNLPTSFCDNVVSDKNNIVWLTVDGKILKLEDGNFSGLVNDLQISNSKPQRYSQIECDNNNNKWFFSYHKTYSYNDTTWKEYDSTITGFSSGYKIVNNKKTSELFFCTNNGLFIHKDNTWSKIDKNTIKELPSNRVYFAKRDSKNRLWIGTFDGTVLIDENGKAICYENSETILKSKCVSSLEEDENGNIYLELFDFTKKFKSQGISIEISLAVILKDGTINSFTTSNSGLPINKISKIKYDSIEKVLWIITSNAGLVRYDLKQTWENYHSENSDIPTSEIRDIAIDKNGNLFLATKVGLVIMKKK